MSDEPAKGAGAEGAIVTARLPLAVLERLAEEACLRLRQNGVDSVIVAVHCAGTVEAPWCVRYNQADVASAVPFYAEVAKWIVGQLARWWRAPVPAPPAEPTGPLS